MAGKPAPTFEGGLQDQIDALDDILLYDAQKTYTAGDTVRQGQRLYQATADVPTNTPPPSPAFWLDVGQTVGTVGALAQQVELNKTNIETVDGKVVAQASTLNALRAATRDDSGNGSKIDALKGWSSTAAIAREESVRSSAQEATAQRLTTLDASVGDNGAKLTNLERVTATDRTATAESLTQLNAKVGANEATIQTTSKAVADLSGDLSTIWSVKMETAAGGQKYAASFGLGLQVDPSGVSSQFVVRADTFMLLNLANGTPVSPFSVTGGQTFIRSAFIQDGTITNAKIGNYIQSNNYVAGTSGWKLFFDGTFEINGVVPGQGRSIMTNRSLRFWDVNGIKRVQIGDLSE
ncbi:hypothetical protein B5P22_08325 [Pseudomonas tolaasii]|nr:hypothetical protein B5P22_08325 [Pseudomonas tolaasii]